MVFNFFLLVVTSLLKYKTQMTELFWLKGAKCNRDEKPKLDL